MTITSADLLRARDSQYDCVADNIASCREYGLSDDGYDYMKAALHIALELTDMWYDDNITAFAAYIDPKNPEAYYGEACDGWGNALVEISEREHGEHAFAIFMGDA